MNASFGVLIDRLEMVVLAFERMLGTVNGHTNGTTVLPPRRGRPYKFSDAHSWDWTKHNKEISREHGVSISSVSAMRERLGKPRVYAPSQLGARRNWDWTKTDAQLGREHGITRERARQVRLQLGLPTQRESNNERESLQEQLFLKWLDGKTVVRRLDATGQGFNDCSIRRWCARHKLIYIRRNHEPVRNYDNWNFDLPNWMIAEAWGISIGAVRSRRSLGRFTPSIYSRRQSAEDLEKYKDAFAAEKAKAEKFFADQKQATT